MRRRLSELLGVLPEEGTLAAVATTFAALTLLLGVVLRSTHTALLLGAVRPTALGSFYVATGLALMLVSLLYARSSPAHRGRIDALLLLGAAGALLLGRVGLLLVPHAAMAFAVSGLALLVAQFSMLLCFSAVLEPLDSRQVRRLLPLVGAASTVGSLAGGGLVSVLLLWLPNDDLLWVAAALLALAALFPPLLARHGSAVAHEGKPVEATPWRTGMIDGLSTLVHHRHLGRIALLTVLVTGVALLVDFSFKVSLQARYDKQALAHFVGRYYLLSNAALLPVQLFIVRWLTQRLRHGPLHLLTPLALAAAATLAAVLGLLGQPSLWAFVALRGLADLLVPTILSQARDASYAVVPPASRRRANVLVKGVLRPGATLGAALCIAGLAHLPLWATSAAILLLCLLWLPVARSLGRSYLDELKGALKRRQLDPEPADDPVLDRDGRRFFVEQLRQEEPTAASFALEVLARGAPELAHAEAERLLTRPEAEFVRIGARHLATHSPHDAERLAPLLSHPDAGVRAEAAAGVTDGASARLAADGARVLATLARERDPVARRAASVALARLSSASSAALLVELCGDPDPLVLREALLAAGARRLEEAIPALHAALDHPHLASEAATALLAFDDRFAAELARRAAGPLATALSVVGALGRAPGAVPASALAHALATTDSPTLLDRLLRALHERARRGEAPPRDVVTSRLGRECDRALLLTQAQTSCADDERGRVLRFELDHQLEGCRRRILLLLALRGERQTLLRVERSYRSGEPHLRAAALETLEALLPPADREVFLSLLEENDPARRLDRALDALDRRPLPQDALDDALDATAGPWLSSLLASARESHAPAGDHASDVPWSRLDQLAGVPLLSQLSGPALAAVAQIAEDARFPEGAVVCREGEAGDCLFLLLRGRAAVHVRSSFVCELGPGELFGEIALLDGSPRTATVIAREELGALRIRRQAFQELLVAEPLVARGVLSGLVRYLRQRASRPAPPHRGALINLPPRPQEPR
ncbi:MAG: cyclic nucleotide-binding domain-containing protein [Deltaproteobacteria bacterium]|nr:cyclic nucleotide-binding domain-containing protein [Deltaproteobacteria bacterium]